MTTDNKDQDSRLPDYALKISRVFIHICLFIPLIIILRLKLDTFNSEERGTAEEEPMYQKLDIEFASRNRKENVLPIWRKLKDLNVL